MPVHTDQNVRARQRARARDKKANYIWGEMCTVQSFSIIFFLAVLMCKCAEVGAVAAQ